MLPDDDPFFFTFFLLLFAKCEEGGFRLGLVKLGWMLTIAYNTSLLFFFSFIHNNEIINNLKLSFYCVFVVLLLLLASILFSYQLSIDRTTVICVMMMLMIAT